jgi:uncharacterized protein YndB with AHSA1/START domain
MPVRHDSEKRWVEMEILVPGTPEQVWQAMATGAGMTAWFTPTQVEEQVGGRIAFDFGDGGVGSTGIITHWAPPSRLCYEERDWNADAPAVATEVLVTNRGGNHCVVRMVHSLFTTRDSWDGELEGFEAGWPGFFEILRIYLAEFAGTEAACARAMTVTPQDVSGAWKRMTAALDLTGADVADPRESPASAPIFSGTVARIQQSASSRELTLRLEKPCRGVLLLGSYAMGEKTRGAACLYLYGDDAQRVAKAVEPEWADWLSKVLGVAQ